MSLDTLDVTIDKTNKRLKVFEFEEIDKSSTHLIDIAEQEGLDKIILFQNEDSEIIHIEEHGFTKEGEIDGFFDGKDAHLYTKYLSQTRKSSDSVKEENNIIQTIMNTEPATNRALPDEYRIRDATDKDISQIVNVFNEVFKSYPTPMNDRAYVEKAIHSNVEMAVIENHDEIIGLSSAEIDFERNNAEITDCATIPSERGKGINNHLIQYLENKMQRMGITNLFSIARAKSFGMNKVLHNHKYRYRGRLINNVHIAGDWENMNIWVKQL